MAKPVIQLQAIDTKYLKFVPKGVGGRHAKGAFGANWRNQAFALRTPQ
jgi:hypothetical protein